MAEKSGINLFDYLDYRRFLADFFQLKKSLNKHYSHRLFAAKAEIKSCGYFSEVAGGVRNLSKNKVPHFARGLELDERERVYFERLVAFNHAKTNQAKQALYELMVQALPPKHQQIKRTQMEYFSKWYYVAVREALAICRVRDDYDELAAKLRPRITPAQAKSAIRLLGELGLIARDSEGAWRVRHGSLLSKRDEATALLVRSFQGEMIGKAREALETVPPGRRDISTVTMSISAQGMDRLKGAVEDFRKRVREIVQSDRGEDRLVQLNIQVFPLSQIEE
jgi:uncharacterized protein (TIGR02147 family)